MKIETLVNQIAQENSYILSNSSFSFIIDPGSNPEQLLTRLRELNKPLAAIFLTHAHFDHIMGLDQILEAHPETVVLLHQAEFDFLSQPELNASRLLMGRDIISTAKPESYTLESPYHFGETSFSVRYTPGHSIGGVSLIFEKEKLAFTGDALFYHSIGRSDLPTGNQEQLLCSIKNELLTLSNNFKVYPGHGPATDILTEKLENPFLR